MNTFWKIVGYGCLIVYIIIKVNQAGKQPIPKPLPYPPLQEKDIRVHKAIEHFESGEPLPSEVEVEDDPRYQWIMDQDGYSGDWDWWVEKYENETGDF